MSCPICNSSLEAKPQWIPGKDAFLYSCRKCGEFGMTGPASKVLPDLFARDRRNWDRLCHALCWMRRDQGPPLLDCEFVEKLSQRPLPDLPAQIENFVVWLGGKTSPGEGVKVDPETQQAVVGATTRAGFEFVVEHLEATGLIKDSLNRTKDGLGGCLQLTYQGWERYREITRGSRKSRRAFMAMAFNKPELDEIVEKHFRHAVRETGFELFRLDDDPQAGLIDNRLRVEIRRSRFLIADLSHDNAGAYWEAGFAEGLGKPVIYTCVAGKKTHFDARNCQTVFWDAADPAKAAEALRATIRATLPEEAQFEGAQ